MSLDILKQVRIKGLCLPMLINFLMFKESEMIINDFAVYLHSHAASKEHEPLNKKKREQRS